MVIQTLLVYISLTLLLYFAARYSAEKNTLFFIVSAIAVYSVVFGLRSGVGMDFWSYKRWYDDALLGIGSYDHLEPGFRFLMDICAAASLPFSFFLGVVAFIQLLLVFLAVRPFRDAYPFLALVFMLGGIWLSYANGLRQQLAFCIFAYSVHFIADRKWIRYYLCIALAIMFHTSAVFLLPLYPLYIFSDGWVRRKWIVLGLLVAVLLASGTSAVNFIAGYADGLAAYLGYDIYFNDDYELTRTVERGLGYWINLSISVCLIYFGDQVKSYYGSRTVNIIYDLFCFGVLWKYLFIGSLIFSRVNYYFLGFEYIFAALTLAAMSRTFTLKKAVLLSLYGLVFIAIMFRMRTNTAMFMFNWQNVFI
ncbi:MAG: EpsG family protein [Bacteroidales bacterium]|nr:EpsG family protein [Bacteroidales bacterium]